MVDDIFHFGRIDKVSHAKLPTQCLSGRVEVDTYNTCGTDHLGTLNHIEANTAQAKHSNGGARFYLHSEGHRTNTCGHATADIANLVKRRIFTHLRQRDLWKHRIVREG